MQTNQKKIQNSISLVDYNIKRLPYEQYETLSKDLTEIQTEGEGDKAIEEFKRQIQQRYKISVANKLYTFPRRFTKLEDVVSSDEDTSQDQNEEQTHPLKSGIQIQHRNKQKHQQSVLEKEKELEKTKPFKPKQIFIARQHRNISQKSNNENLNNTDIYQKVLKTKKKVKKVKQKIKQKKNESYCSERQKQVPKNKRFNTQPDPPYCVQTMRLKKQKMS